MLKTNRLEVAAFSLFLLLSAWWAVLFFSFHAQLVGPNLIWAATYQVVAIFGIIYGFITAKRWGGFKSVMGRAILFLTFGLFLQIIGQTIFSIYGLFLNTDVPYPSLADVGFFGSIPFYAFGIFQLGKAAGAHSMIKSFKGVAVSIILPFIMLAVSYFFFLRNYTINLDYPLRVFLDFGYPLGQAIYVSLALLVYFLSRNFLGGIMKLKILVILLALILQYIADFNFLYQYSKGTWINGGYGDVLYMTAYFVMTLGLIYMGTTFEKIKEGDVI